MARINPIERQMARFLRKPVTVRSAASVIVTSTAVIVVVSGVLMRLLDHREYRNVFIGMWWAVQTVTTVGYGDVTPKDVAGRVVATFVMLKAVALVAIVTAAITSTFVARAARVQELTAAADEQKEEARNQARFEELSERLDRLEMLLRSVAER